MSELLGIAAGVGSAVFGGTAITGIRYLAPSTDPFTLAAIRFGIGVLVLFPIACLKQERWPSLRDLPVVALLGILFFVLFPVILNQALVFTTAGRAALTLATLPLLTMAVAALLRVERFTWRKAIAALIALGGVAVALWGGLAQAPADSWLGDLMMLGGTLFLAFYNIWSRRFIVRSGPLRFTSLGMAVSMPILFLIAWLNGGLAGLADYTGAQALVALYVGLVGGALAYWLWAEAIARTTPTRVAMAITTNAVAAGVAGAVALGEPIGWSLLLGVAAVAVALTLATRPDRR
ncbi:DMT family transporter [Geminicoccus harenae]|uniref:DMT family transporter n=1 Tax=Geminicoccus harenae TaxID=2498453 RepID=UPI001C966707|nr:DMT family transporter [Geminicoccus harenae]